MDFTLYTFGDVEVFRAALAGVAMVFNPADGFFVSNSGMGLGALAGLGLLIGLMIMLLQGVTKQRVELGEYTMLIIVFVLLFVPKFSVNVEDYNGSAIAKVDNVPLGVAFPAGMVSGLARELNLRLGTAFSTVNGYPSGMMTPEALTSPLKLLHSLRDGAPQVDYFEPRMMQNLRNLIAYCAAGRPGVEESWKRWTVADDPIMQLVSLAGGQQGLTPYVPPDGTEAGLRTCAEAGAEVSASLSTFIDQSLPTASVSRVLTAAATKSNAANVLVQGATPQVQPVTPDDQAQALATLAQTEATTAAKFLRAALLNPDAASVLACAGKSANPENWATCMPFQEAVLRYAEDSAAAGSFFQRLMFHGMNVMFFLWICLAPVVATVMLMMGVRGLRLAASYVLFGAWAVSWYVGASIVNFYMLKQVQYEVAMLGGIANLTEETLKMFVGYGGVLGTKLAMAGDMMASVPLIMLSVMSGSIYGMTQLATRFGGREQYDSSRVVPPAANAAPLFEREARHAGRYDGVAVDRVAGAGGSFDFSWGAQIADADSIQSQKQLTTSVFNGITNSLSQGWENAKTHQDLVDFGKRLAASGYEGMSFTDLRGRSYTVARGEGFAISDRNSTGEQAGWNVSGGAGTGPGKGLTGGVGASLGAEAGEAHSVDQTRDGKTTTGKDAGVRLEEQGGARFSRALQAGDAASIAQAFKASAGHLYQRAFGSEQREVDSLAESGGTTHSTTAALGGKLAFSSEEAANRIRQMGLSRSLGAYVDQRYGWSQAAQQRYAEAERNAQREFAGVLNGKDDLVKLRALQQTALLSGEARAQEAFGHFTQQFAGVDTGGIKAVSGMTAGTYGQAATDWEASAGRGAGVRGPDEKRAIQESPGTIGARAAGGEAKVRAEYTHIAADKRGQAEQALKTAADRQRGLVGANAPPGIDVDLGKRPGGSH